MSKLLLCITLLALTAPHAGAQGVEKGAGVAEGAGPPSGRLGDVKAEAARLLESPARRERAWGAYLAGRHGLGDLAPALVRTFSDPALGDGPEEAIVRQAALDSLIRLDAKVPAEVLRALPQSFSAEVVILLSASPEENQAALLEMFAALTGGDGADAHWLAVGNLLAGSRARGFAALLLRELKVEADIAVLDREGDYGFGYGGGGGCGGGFSHPPEDFPPVSYYSLTDRAERDAVVIAPGRRPVFYLRSTNPHHGGSCSRPPVRDVVRVEYLAALLETTEDDLGFEARPSTSVVCQEPRQCRRALADVRGHIERSYAALVGRLAEKSLLDGAGDAPASPPLTFTLYDHRRRQTFPLPAALEGVTLIIEEMGSGGAAGAGAP